jgi:hypothetical protein
MPPVASAQRRRPWMGLASGMVVLMTLATVGRASAQTAPSALGVGASYEFYNFSDATAADMQSLSLLTVPVAGRAALGRGFDLVLSGAFGSARMVRTDGTATTLSGLTDTQLRLSYGSPNGVVTVTGIALLPTGQTRQTADEADVAGAIAADVLPFSITNWGSGGGGGASIALAQSFGASALGVSLGYVVAAQFKPLEATSFAYRPGNQLHVRVAADHDFGVSGKLSLQMSYQHFGDDQYDGANLFRSGDRIEATSSYAFGVGARSSGMVYAGYLRRQHGTFVSGAGIAPAQNLFIFGGAARMPLGSTVLEPRIDVRALGQAPGVGRGYTAGIGGSLEWRASRSVMVIPTVLGRFGHVSLPQGSATGLTGADIGLALRFGRPRF